MSPIPPGAMPNRWDFIADFFVEPLPKSKSSSASQTSSATERSTTLSRSKSFGPSAAKPISKKELVTSFKKRVASALKLAVDVAIRTILASLYVYIFRAIINAWM